ncbi:hypothetical protein B0T26DRAFT_244646 [Lasiosphaeria miniovina]|uniref:Uncharacterized protein n=1 Tax=Lasiosphaeria miniovina TaxID=1954250 RepID=A0AA40AVV6_9PEZI|nr:uncharacterized protein B0T26DRAFT_244646 [Lasiosphaeria miniovina]KAK0722995.1 hypothetical protein B0T26DRAFT_244646 [Lasiosphaeria miniovina]
MSWRHGYHSIICSVASWLSLLGVWDTCGLVAGVVALYRVSLGVVCSAELAIRLPGRAGYCIRISRHDRLVTSTFSPLNSRFLHKIQNRVAGRFIHIQRAGASTMRGSLVGKLPVLPFVGCTILCLDYH